jgi:hypothetical protein
MFSIHGDSELSELSRKGAKHQNMASSALVNSPIGKVTMAGKSLSDFEDFTAETA